MSSRYKQMRNGDSEVMFSQAAFGSAEHSRMGSAPRHITTFNAGDIIPIYCREVLPTQHLSLDVDAVIRQMTLQTPTMGEMVVDFDAFFVPNRVVNKSFKAVMGEAYNKAWTANKVTLAPLYSASEASTNRTIQIPVGSVADYYGFATQKPFPTKILTQCHDLKFRGYVSIYNEYFRDENYQPPIPMSTLNVYQGFLSDFSAGQMSLLGISIDGTYGGTTSVLSGSPSDGSFGAGAVNYELYGSGSEATGASFSSQVRGRSVVNAFSALGKPLKAAKLHDYFTTVLPQPQKAPIQVLIPVSGDLDAIPVETGNPSNLPSTSNYPIQFRQVSGLPIDTGNFNVAIQNGGTAVMGSLPTGATVGAQIKIANLQTKPGQVTGMSFDIADLRMASAIQQVYEALGRGGSRYREYLRSFFGVTVDDPFDDIPKRLGHVRRSLDLYQTAQTSSSQEGSTPQGNLAAFGYTATRGTLFNDVGFLEHGYIHVFAIIRHKNVYPAYFDKSNLRMSMLDFYHPQLANISEQPVRACEINPFCGNVTDVFGYQEAWAEYRYEPDQVSGYMRPGLTDSLSVWNYADNFDENLEIADADWIQSNSEEVLNRTITVTSSVAPQFKAVFMFPLEKDLPMPTFSVPGMDII